MSAPKSIGVEPYGEANVLSIINGKPFSCAMLATASTSSTFKLGLP